MNLRRHILRRNLLPALLFTGVAALLASPDSWAFAVYGDVLDLTQRDFRVLNNFIGPRANTNQVPDPDFPGALGAELALRKGAAEWGSRPHGSGTTDPTQAVLGSGGSNFDAFFSGLALGPGNSDANIISAVPSAGAAIAQTDIPIGDGWRIRFFEGAVTWCDDPEGALAGISPVDLQGVMTHEFGHALGLDHSTVPGATMGVTTANAGLDLRSIEQDDRDGLAFLYGALDPAKPVIETYEFTPTGALRLVGAGFHPTDNEVWFTPSDPSFPGDGTPVKLLAVPSVAGSAGTRIEVNVPASAGPGDVAVLLPAPGAAALSNVFPFDPQRPPWSPPSPYGSPGTSSVGGPIRINYSGLPSVTAGHFTIGVTGATPTFSIGSAMVVAGTQPGLSVTGFGTLLLSGSVRRVATIPLFLGTGSAEVSLPPGAVIGNRIFYQVWVPDGAAAGGAFCDALEIELVP